MKGKDAKRARTSKIGAASARKRGWPWAAAASCSCCCWFKQGFETGDVQGAAALFEQRYDDL